jgi:hypothetical protein
MLSTKAQENKKQDVLAGIDEVYEQQTQKVMSQWQGEQSGD